METKMWNALGAAVLFAGAAVAAPATVTSPNGQIAVTVSAEKGLTWEVMRKGKSVILPSNLGLSFKRQRPFGAFEVVKTEERAFDTVWTNRLYKKALVRDNAHELTVHLREKDAPKRLLDVVVRAYDGGVALRYGIPAQPGFELFTLSKDCTTWRFPGDPLAWLTIYGDHRTSQERPFLHRSLRSAIGEKTLVGMPAVVELNGQTIGEHVFDTTTYQKTLLPVTLNAEVPEQFENDEFVLSGKTTKGVTLQCIVTGGRKDYDKTVRTNNNGKFSFHIPTDNQSVYNVTLILQKKNYETRRFSWTANRTLTDRDVRNQYREEAVKPAYSTLNRKLEAYTGRVMGYKVYITDIQHVGDEYIVTAAMTKTKKGNLKDIIVISSAEEPVFVVGSEQVFYGRLTGLHEVQSEEGATGYPHFELLFWDE